MSAIRYEPAIDGLRAIAVMAVIAYHLAPTLLPGGFTGVDLFFVISGFLITRIITHELDAGTFSLIGFYQRRIARIIPPLVVMAAIALLVACHLYTSQDRASAGANFAATLLSITNIKLSAQGNYFEMSSDSQPFLHCWSLSVEEQFYLIFPFLLSALYRASRRLAIVVGCVAFCVSFALCVWLTPICQQWSFYMLPTRAWELLAGALVSRFQFARSGRMVHGCFGIGSVALLSWAIVSTSGESLFPGPLTIVPVVGAVGILVITANGTESLLARFCSGAWLRSIGAISYSLYLWHWPIFSFADYGLMFAPTMVRGAIKIVVCVAAACGSYVYIEKPARSWLGREQNVRAAFVFLAGCVAAGVPIGLWVRTHSYVNATPRDLASGGICINPQGWAGTVVLVGDSLASMYGAALREICVAENRKLVVLSVAGKNPLISDADQKNVLWDQTYDAVKRERPDVVFVGCQWSPRIHDRPGFPSVVLDAIRPFTKVIVLINAVPGYLTKAAGQQFDRATGPRSSRPMSPTRHASVPMRRWLLTKALRSGSSTRPSTSRAPTVRWWFWTPRVDASIRTARMFRDGVRRFLQRNSGKQSDTFRLIRNDCAQRSAPDHVGIGRLGAATRPVSSRNW